MLRREGPIKHKEERFKSAVGREYHSLLVEEADAQLLVVVEDYDLMGLSRRPLRRVDGVRGYTETAPRRWRSGRIDGVDGLASMASRRAAVATLDAMRTARHAVDATNAQATTSWASSR